MSALPLALVPILLRHLHLLRSKSIAGRLHFRQQDPVLQVTAPARTGLWTLELDMVDEGVTWFRNQGSPMARLDVVVRGATGS